MRPEGMSGMSPLILALDTDDLDSARRVAAVVAGSVSVVKIGLQLFTACGPAAVRALKSDGFEVFLDLKMSDIPNTVSSACLAACPFEPLMMTLHTMGGQEMMRCAAAAVREGCSEKGARPPALIGVTVLTSLDLLALKKIGVSNSVEDEVLKLARLGADSGLDGLVASPLEVKRVRNAIGDEAIIVAPGVRPVGAAPDDQKRVASFGDAIRWGADFVVVGRPLMNADDPAGAAKKILEEASA